MDALPNTPHYGSLEALRGYVDDICGERERGDWVAILASALRSLIPLAKAEAERRGDPAVGYDCIFEAHSVIIALQLGLGPGWKSNGYGGRLWVHTRTLPEPGSDDAHAVEKTEVEAVAAQYLQKPWMSNGHLDWIIVDALTRQELVAFEAEVARARGDPRLSMAWWMQWTLAVALPWAIEGIIALGVAWWLLGEYGQIAPYRHWWAAAAALYYGLSAIRLVRSARVRRGRRREAAQDMAKVSDLCATMRDTYLELRGPVLNPTRVRDVLLAAEAKGARWSTATWPVLEGAIRRNSTIWVTEAP